MCDCCQKYESLKHVIVSIHTICACARVQAVETARWVAVKSTNGRCYPPQTKKKEAEVIACGVIKVHLCTFRFESVRDPSQC